MLFLIEFDRETDRLVRIEEFADADRERANKARIDLEVDLLRAGVSREVVMLEARNKEALRVTHRRYFESLELFVKSLAASAALGVPLFGEPARVREGDAK